MHLLLEDLELGVLKKSGKCLPSTNTWFFMLQYSGYFSFYYKKPPLCFSFFRSWQFFYFLRGLYAPTVSTYINDKVDSSNRATMLSVNSQLLTIVTSVSLLFAGYIADRYDLSTTFFAISISSIFFLIIYVLSLRKVEAD